MAFRDVHPNSFGKTGNRNPKLNPAVAYLENIRRQDTYSLGPNRYQSPVLAFIPSGAPIFTSERNDLRKIECPFEQRARGSSTPAGTTA